MKMIVDVSILAELAKPKPSERAIDWATSVTKIVLSAVTLEELQHAIARNTAPEHKADVEKWLDSFINSHCDVLPVTGEIALEAGRLRIDQAERGKHLSQSEALLAVNAMKHSLLLVTSAPRTFSECDLQVYNPL